MEVETSLLLGVLFLLILLVLSFFGYLVYSGLLSEINIGTKNNPLKRLTVAYKFARGPYKNAGDLFTEVHALTPDLKCIGIYYDCPDEVIPQRLRYVVGAILSEGDNEVNEDQKNLLVNRGYKVTNFPLVSHAVVTSFPFVNTFSVFIAIIKVYPKINQYITERSLSAHPMMEIYEKGVIFFVAPLARQDEFYVPESLEEDDDGEDSVVSTAQSDGDESVITDTEPTHQGTEQVELAENEEESTGNEEENAGDSDDSTVDRDDSAPITDPESVGHEGSAHEATGSLGQSKSSSSPSRDLEPSRKTEGHDESLLAETDPNEHPDIRSESTGDSESMRKIAGPQGDKGTGTTERLDKDEDTTTDLKPTHQATEHGKTPQEPSGHLDKEDGGTMSLQTNHQSTQQIEESETAVPTSHLDGAVTEKGPEEVISRSEEKTESSATAANTSEEETSQREESPVAEGASVQHPEEEKSGEVEGRSSEQGDDDSSASSSFEELTLDAAESESNDKATS